MTNDNKPDKPAHYEPKGNYFVFRGIRFIHVTEGHWKNWICYQHPDGQWVTLYHIPDETEELRQQLTTAKPAIDFCAGIHIEALTLLNQADHPTLTQICEENQSLRAENKILKEQVEDFQEQRGELIPENILLQEELSEAKKNLNSLNRFFDDLQTENVALRAELAKHVCPTCEKSGDNSFCSDSWHQRVANNKAAREWVEKHGPELILFLEKEGMNTRGYTELRALQPEEKK